MKLLAVDTATQTCSVAIAEDDALLVELTVNHAQTHARHLLGMVHEVLKRADIPVNALDGFAVTVGPGSFTGLRIGIGTVKGLALAAAKPVAAISSLAALAAPLVGSTDLICPWIDARKQEVYAAGYRWKANRLETVAAPQVAPPESILAHIHEPAVFVGNGAVLYGDRIEAQLGASAAFRPAGMNTIRASMVARLGFQVFSNRDEQPSHLLAPVYIRRSDARKPGKKKT